MNDNHAITPDLTRDEWHAVSIALHDAERGCMEDGNGLLARFYRALTGNAPPARLADPRLEAVRRFVCDSRRHRQPADDLIPVLEAQGFNDRQIGALALLAA